MAVFWALALCLGPVFKDQSMSPFCGRWDGDGDPEEGSLDLQQEWQGRGGKYSGTWENVTGQEYRKGAGRDESGGLELDRWLEVWGPGRREPWSTQDQIVKSLWVMVTSDQSSEGFNRGRTPSKLFLKAPSGSHVGGRTCLTPDPVLWTKICCLPTPSWSCL